jgi:hypothetical protein
MEREIALRACSPRHSLIEWMLLLIEVAEEEEDYSICFSERISFRELQEMAVSILPSSLAMKWLRMTGSRARWV